MPMPPSMSMFWRRREDSAALEVSWLIVDFLRLAAPPPYRDLARPDAETGVSSARFWLIRDIREGLASALLSRADPCPLLCPDEERVPLMARLAFSLEDNCIGDTCAAMFVDDYTSWNDDNNIF